MHIIIIGSGIAGITFAEKYRSLTPDAKITVLTWETSGYYSRPMLSHGFSKENIEHSIVLKPFDSLLENNICIISGVEVTNIATDTQTITISGNHELETLSYDKLILAQGSAAFIPPPFQAYQDNFFLFNSLKDLKQLRQLRQPLLDQHKTPHWAIIGGGLIGCELASDLAKAGDQVTLFHAMDRLMERQLATEDSETLINILDDAGVKVLLNQAVQNIQNKGNQTSITSNDTEDCLFDAVIVSCGFKPRTEIAELAGLDTGRGIQVDQYLQTSNENIYALGDVAELPNEKIYAFILPIRSQALWLANHLTQSNDVGWSVPVFKAKAKVHGFQAEHPYNV